VVRNLTSSTWGHGFFRIFPDLYTLKTRQKA
jgi:hypothetical protein